MIYNHLTILYPLIITICSFTSSTPAMALLVTLVTLLAFSAPPALGQPAKVPAKAPAKLPVAVQPGLTCTPWSWRLCKLVAPKVYQVMVDAEGGGGERSGAH